MKRLVKIRLDGGNVIEKTASSVTFGELKKEIGMNFEGQKVIIRETRHTLEDDEARLPLQDFNLFVYPLKVKNGMDYSEMDYAHLRRLCIDRGLQKEPNGFANYGNTELMVTKLEAHDAECNACDCAETPKDMLLNVIDEIQERFDTLRDMVEEIGEDTIANEVDKLTEEFEEIRKTLQPFGVE